MKIHKEKLLYCKIKTYEIILVSAFRTPWGYSQGDGSKYHFEINAKMKSGTWTYTPAGKSATVGTVHGSKKYDTDKLKELLQELKNKSSESSLYVSSQEKGILANEFLRRLAEDRNNQGRTLVFNQEDENGNTLYQWIFDGGVIGDFEKDVDLGIDITTDNLRSYGITKKDGTVLLNFRHNGKLPKGTRLRIPTRPYGFVEGDMVHVFYYNQSTKQLEEYVYEAEYFTIVEEDGTTEFGITHCSEYILSKYSLEELTAAEADTSGGTEQTNADISGGKSGQTGKAAKTGDANDFMVMLIFACGALLTVSAVLYRKKRINGGHVQ